MVEGAVRSTSSGEVRRFQQFSQQFSAASLSLLPQTVSTVSAVSAVSAEKFHFRNLPLTAFENGSNSMFELNSNDVQGEDEEPSGNVAVRDFRTLVGGVLPDGFRLEDDGDHIREPAVGSRPPFSSCEDQEAVTAELMTWGAAAGRIDETNIPTTC